MSGVTQTIPSYGVGGISEQPDQQKYPGQVKNVVNAIPDITYGLYKRPGSKRVGTAPLTSVGSGGSWFHYYRDETEGSYIGQVLADGTLNVWRCSDGTKMTTVYGTGGETAIKTYLSASNTEDLQFLTINDTTFVNNRDTTVALTGTTTARPDTHFAYIDLLQVQNGRQYALNVYNSETTTSIARATRVKITATNQATGAGTGHCPGIGTQVFAASETDIGSKTNLTFRITALGQQGSGDQDDEVADATGYQCTYNNRVQLLHGGEGWTTGDATTVTLDQALTNYTFTVTVMDHEDVPVKADIKAVRPAPTPFDAETAATADTILGGIITELGSTGITCTVIGNGMYLTKSSAFQVEVLEPDLMRVMQSSVQSVAELPGQCKDGYIVKVSNSQQSDEDDYYLRFDGENGKDGPGSWSECAEPGIDKSFNVATMPHVIQRTGATEFTVKQFTYPDREVGDNTTNPIPKFVGEKINRVLFFRNRLVFLAGQYCVSCRPGSVGTPNFWANTALAVSNIDPISITSSSMLPSPLYDGVEINAGLVVFSSNQQFLFSSDDTVLNPDTAKLRAISSYNYNIVIPPISMGTTVGYIDNSGQYSRFNEMANSGREAEPTVVETSRLVPSLLPKDIDLLTNSRENAIVLFGQTDSDEVIGYKYFVMGDKRPQSSWFKWKHNNPLKYHFIVNDQYYFLDTDNFLQSINLQQASTDPSINQDSINYLIHLDNYTTVANGVYDAATKKTTFTNQSDWIDQVTSPNGSLVIVDTNKDTTRIGRYAECTVINGDDFTVPGNWDFSEEWEVAYTSVNASNEQITLTTGSTDHGLETGDEIRWVEGASTATGLTDGTTYYVIDASINNIALASSLSNANAGVAVNITAQGTGIHKIQKLIKTLHIGYLYEYSVEFPRIYVTKAEGQRIRADVNASLIVHRLKLNFGKVGLYSTTLNRVGKDPYTEIYESTELDEYDASDAPYLEEVVKTIPVYEKNKNVDIILKSSHPAPATLHSMSWEGDYSQKYYRRV